MSEVVTKLLGHGIDRNAHDKVPNDYLTLATCPRLEVARFNLEMVNKVKKETKQEDVDFQDIQKLLMKGIIAVFTNKFSHE